MDSVYPICVIGGGSAGTMSVLRAVLNNDRVLFFPGDGPHRKKSREFWVRKVQNIPGYHHFEKGIIGPNQETLEWIQQHPLGKNLAMKKNRAVVSMAKNKQGLFEIEDNKGEIYHAQFVVLCTGIMDVQPLIEGSIQPIFPYANSQHVEYCLRCDGHHSYQKKTAVIGFNFHTPWVATMLYERYQNPAMFILTNGEKLQTDGETENLLKIYPFKVIENKIVKILGDSKKGILQGFQFDDKSEIEVECAFISLGIIAYSELAKKLGAEVDGRGLILTDSKGQSSVANLFAAGDVRANAKKQIYTAYDQAVDALDEINARLRKEDRAILIAGLK